MGKVSSDALALEASRIYGEGPLPPAAQWPGGRLEVTSKGALERGKPGDFAAALRSLKDGKRVRRRSWPAKTLLKLWQSDSVTEACLPHVVCCRADGTAIPYSVGHDSLLAEDWELVE